MTLPAAVRVRIARERVASATLQAIADQLNADQVLTARGRGPWHRCTVRAVLTSLALEAAAAAAQGASELATTA